MTCKGNRPKVAITAAADYSQQAVDNAIRRQFELLDPQNRLIEPGQRVLIKPNLIGPKPVEIPAMTHPAVIIATAKYVMDQGATPFVGDSPAWGSVEKCLAAMNGIEPLRKLGIEIRQLDKPVRLKIASSRIGISRHALEADKIINLPKFKAHQQITATFAIKNMFGCVPGKEKPFWHFARGGSFERFSEMLIEIHRTLAPCINIIDGIVAMQGAGPSRGTAKPLGVIVGSTEPVACEFVCAKIASMDPETLPIIRTARKINFGPAGLAEIDIIGDKIADFICPDFEHPQLTELKFTFPRICKSVARQIILTLRGQKYKGPA